MTKPVGEIILDSLPELKFLPIKKGELRNSAFEYKRVDDIVKTMLDNVVMGISMINPKMEIVWLNKTFQQWFPHIDSKKRPLCYKSFYSPPREKICDYCPTIKAFKTGEIHSSEADVCADGKIYNVIATPVKDEKGNVTYVVETVEDITERKKTEEKLEILNKELLKSNRRLRQLSLKDPGTGLYNHRYLEEIIEAEFHRAQRYAHSISVIMLDIDYFKSINDVYGHQFGDLVLKQFARQLKQMVRRYDTVIRFGGEEFIIISPGTDRSIALILAQRLLEAIELYNFGDKKHTVRLQLSIAVASYPDDKIVSGMDLIEVSDHILNKAKEYGGNRVYSSLDMRDREISVLEKSGESPEVKQLRSKIEKITKRANQNLIESIFAFAKTIELKDHYTGEHVERTVHYAVETAKGLSLPKDKIEFIRQASMLHDLGKIGISERILLKRSKLTKSEFEEIKKHPQIAVDILRQIQFLHSIIPLIFCHHEKWNGRGYPSGLKGEEIPLGARIVAIADVFQALISDRPYRKAYPKDRAIKIIKAGSGTQFDPRIVCVFLKILRNSK